MKKRIFRPILVLLIVCGIVGTGIAITLSGVPQGQPPQAALPDLEGCPSLQRGIVFLNARYNPDTGLLNESPQAAPQKYWLTNDNALAAYTLSRLGEAEKSSTLQSALRRYGYDSNGLVEVIWGRPVSFPPYVARQDMLSTVGNAEIWQEFHSDGPRFADWADYADLGFLGALNEYRLGHIPESLSIFSRTLAQFDGKGFQDKAFNGQYETYKLALALYVGATIQAPNPRGEQILKILISMQRADGGFITHYRGRSTPVGDANTETTSYALLAQIAYRCGDSK